MKNLKIFTLCLLILGLNACDESGPQNKGVYMLLDTSGTYTNELEKAQQVITVFLAKMNPTDAFAVARIDTGSFSEKDIIAKASFDERPSITNQQKRQFQQTVNQFVETVKSAAYTDITGGVLQGIEWLNEKGTGKKTILIYSDLKEEVKKGYVREGLELNLAGFNVIALNVTKLNSDNVDPREYTDRLEKWKSRVESGGGTWQVINDMDQLADLLDQG